MAFPTTPLDVLVELLLGGTWTDITEQAYTRGSIQITRGRQDEGTRTDPGKCTLTLDNRSGNFSPGNPLGAYYGQIGRNTPVRVSVNAGSTYLATPGTTAAGTGASTPDTAALDITGDIDIRFEGVLDNWITSGISNSTELCGKGATTGNQRSWLLLMRDGKLHFEWSTAGTSTIEKDSTVAVPVPPSRRLAVRVTLDVDNGAAGNTVTFYTAQTIAGPWTQLGDPVVTAGVTSIFASTAAVRVGEGWSDLTFPSCDGRVLAFELRTGLDGTVVANPDFTVQTAGATSFADSTGKTWTVGANTTISNRRTRFVGEISSWPSRWDVSGEDVEVSAEAAGLLRRLDQGARPLDSTLRRRIPSDSSLLAYWPMEDGANSTQAYSPITGIRPMTTSGLSFASDSSLAGSSPLPTLQTGGRLAGNVPTGSGGGWHVELVYNLSELPASTVTMFQVQVAGSAIAKALVRPSTSAIRIELRDADDAVVAFFDYTDADALAAFVGDWCRLQIFARDVGADTDVYAQWIKINTDQTWFAFTTFTGNPGNVSAVTSGTVSSVYDGMPIGHIAAFDTTDVVIYNSADHGFTGDTAGERMERLASEESIPIAVYGDTDLQQRVGAQLPATFLDLLGEAADADGGILYEEREARELAYRDRRSFYNQIPALVLDYATAGHVAPDLAPVDDDQTVRNDVTVQRAGGSFGRAVQETGPLNIQDPEDDPDGVGVYADSVTLNLYDDDQPEQIAAWRVHLGTQPGTRYPSVNVDLAAGPGLIDDVTAVDIGERIQITNPPAGQPPDTIDLIARGYTETIGHPNDWDIQFNCTPARAWNIWELGADDYTRLKSSGSTLAAGVTSTATDLSVASSGRIWVRNPKAAPLNLRIGGEVMTITTVGTLLNSNPYFETSATGWDATNSTIVRSTAVVHPKGVASLRITPNGVSAQGGTVANTSSGVGTVAPGDTVIVSAWIYSPAGWSDIRPVIDWYTSANAYISTSTGSTIAIPAGAWTHVQQTLTAPATTSRLRPRVQHAGTPAATDIYYVWGVRAIPTASNATSPQPMVAVRSVNGVVKAHSSGATVQLDHPLVIGL